ncbi:hypothetical protein CEXT_57681 [Caerostris extrusa]|uniref:Uncharacterized protein n=1 Tax=Caerostris extrusa TaxID=172846 RepID=A0AAV4VED0_CAEEX|nr:hypothetical protein CEXT_57681 [Caerostris extrusa]
MNMSCPAHKQSNGPDSQKRQYISKTSLPPSPGPRLHGFRILLLSLRSHEERKLSSAASAFFFGRDNSAPEPAASPGISTCHSLSMRSAERILCSCCEG